MESSKRLDESRRFATVEEVVRRNLQRIAQDLKEIPGLLCIDFIDIFPISAEHRRILDDEMRMKATVLQMTERGNIYLLNTPIITPYGELKYLKVRFFDESRLNWEAAADFGVTDRQILLDRVGRDGRFSYIERPDWTAVEFKTADTLVYFLEPLASEVYDKPKE